MTKKNLITTFTTGLVIAGTYAGAVALTPVAAPELHLLPPASQTIIADDSLAQAVVADQALPTAISWAETENVWSNDDTAYSLASITKLVTMLVTLEAHGLDPDPNTWPELVWSEADSILQQEYIALEGVAFPVSVGTSFALEDVFKLIFLPSANDFVAAYAYSVFADNDALVAAVYDWAARNEITSLEYAEPTGLAEENKATAADVVRIGKLALEDPIISQFVRLPADVVPGVAEVENTNLLLAEDPAVIGIKTGRSYIAGFNFVVAATDGLADREVVRIAATMGRDTVEDRAESGREMLRELANLPVTTTVIAEGELVATVTDWQGESIDILATTGFETTLLPGETVTIDLAAAELNYPITAQQNAGALHITAPGKDFDIQLQTTGELNEPTFMWRLTHPFEIWF